MAGAGKKGRNDRFLRKHLGPRKTASSTFLPAPDDPVCSQYFPTRPPLTTPRGSIGPCARSSRRAGHISAPTSACLNQRILTGDDLKRGRRDLRSPRPRFRWGVTSAIIQRASSRSSRRCASRRQTRRESGHDQRARLTHWESGGHRCHNNMS